MLPTYIVCILLLELILLNFVAIFYCYNNQYQNDVDYQVAKVLATQVIEETPFEEISNRAYEEAIKAVQMCDTVIDAGVQIGSANRKLLNIIEEAKRLGKM